MRQGSRNSGIVRHGLLAACVALGLGAVIARPASAGVPGMDEATEQPAPAAPDAAPDTAPAWPPAGPSTPAPPASEPPGSELPPPARHTRARRLDEIPWPGTFVAVRFAMSAGEALIPKFGFGPDSSAIDTVGQFAPYLGTELFYSGKHWGGGVSFDGSFVSLTPSSAWAHSPVHLLAGINVSYIQNRRVRWVLGFNPYTYFKFSFPSGENLASRGIGLRAGVNIRISEPTPASAWELFAFLSVDRFTQVVAGTNGQTQIYNSFDFTGSDSYTGMRLFLVGVQWNFAY